MAPRKGSRSRMLSLMADSPRKTGLGVRSSLGSRSSVSNLTVSSESFKLNWFGFGFFCVVFTLINRKAK